MELPDPLSQGLGILLLSHGTTDIPVQSPEPVHADVDRARLQQAHHAP
jgi:hypothetical protein